MKMKRKKIAKLRIILKKADISLLRKITGSGTRNARVITRARILLMSNEKKTYREIATALGCSPRSITGIRDRFIQRKRDASAAIKDAPRSGQPKKIFPVHEAFVVATACTNAPDAHAHWTLKALKDKLLENYTELKTVSDERIRQILIRNELKPWREKNVVRSKSHAALS